MGGDEKLLCNLLQGAGAVNAGPHAKELLLEHAEQTFETGDRLHSVLYQVRALCQALQERYIPLPYTTKTTTTPESMPPLMERLNTWERADIETNPLMQYALQKITATSSSTTSNTSFEVFAKSEPEVRNFLCDIVDPADGIRQIQDMCQEMPTEWTILQVCKGPRPDTTYSTFEQIHEQSAAIYLTLLRHARSVEYPQPLCLRFEGTEGVELFRKFSRIACIFKQSINVDSKTMDRRSKQQYWEKLHEIDLYIATAIEYFRNFFYPWNFLFVGRPNPHAHRASSEQRRWEAKAFSSVDDFCAEHKWEARERVLLSLAALHVASLSDLELHAICMELSGSQQGAAGKLLLKLKSLAQQGAVPEEDAKQICDGSGIISQHYPCILIVDERLDHFYWEELNVRQEYTRVNSLQCLWRLFVHYRQRIRGGYLTVNIAKGGCLVDPDGNLPRSELRLRRFFEYWTPHWRMKFREKPTQGELFEEYFKQPCYIYAGHGSGLQYVKGKHIANQQMNGCVVFLFGCDSSRMHSNGLYSELLGTHLYYQAAMCPTLVGTLMPGLDANMDSVATDVLSRWIAPASKHVAPWADIERVAWSKQGVIKPKIKIIDTPASDHRQIGSLCAILARVHQRVYESKYYNTVPYVCRGLPVWNCDVQTLPN